MGLPHRIEKLVPQEIIPLVFYDHDGFASADLDGEPSYRWPEYWSGDESWNEAVDLAGPPLYGVGQNATVT